MSGQGCVEYKPLSGLGRRRSEEVRILLEAPGEGYSKY